MIVVSGFAWLDSSKSPSGRLHAHERDQPSIDRHLGPGGVICPRRSLREVVYDRPFARAGESCQTNELSDQLDTKLREQLRGVDLQREQMMRLFQIRLQVNAVSDSLANERLASRLEITDEQKQKFVEINKELQSKQTELYAKMSNASQGERGSMYQELRQLRTDADQKALGVLTAEQKTSFEEMKGKIIELQSRRGQRGAS